MSIITLTYHYLLAVAVVAFGTMLISLILSLDSIRPKSIATPSFFFPLKTVVHKFFVDDAKGSSALIKPVLILGNTGEVMFSMGQGNEADDKTYQLLSNSRFSFIGCWLVLSPTSNTNHLAKVLKPPKEIFIFKDSISEQDYSRIARVINQL